MSMVGILQLLQAVTLAVFVSIVLGGILSALLTLGLFEVGGRAALNRRLFGTFANQGVFDALLAATRIDRTALLNLHYRQICAQMASIATGSVDTPGRRAFLDVLLGLVPPANIEKTPEGTAPPPDIRETPFAISPAAPVPDPKARQAEIEKQQAEVEAALGRIDQIQITAGVVQNRLLLFRIALFWSLLFVSACLAVFLAAIWPAGGVWGFVLGVPGAILSLVLLALGVAVLSFSVATVAVLLFSVLDRFLAAK